MASQPIVPPAPPSDDGDDGSRLHIRSIKEMPAGHDAELATIFREMRRAADVPREKMAGRLAISVEVIDALESGAINALPPWGELTRIITAYSALLGLDARPILRRLEGQIGPDTHMAAPPPPKTDAPIAAPTPAAKPAGPPMPPSAAPRPDAAPPVPGSSAPPKADAPAPAGASPGAQAPPSPREDSAASAAGGKETKKKRLPGFFKALLNWLVLAGFVSALGFGVWQAARHPRMVWSTLDTLPEPIPSVMRSAWNFLRPLEKTSPGSQISDPDNRKSDKLP
jgi:cytoskeletal protein RodZ